MSETHNTFNVGLIQMAMSDDTEANLARAQELIAQAAGQGADVICLPELFRSRYFCQTEDADLFDLAESIPGPSTQALGEQAKELGVAIVASLFEKRAAGLYHNTCVVIGDDGEVTGVYRKMHIPDDPCYYEKFYFTPGDLGFLAVPYRGSKLGVLVCWDQWYPEAARLTGLTGADILFYPTAIGWHPAEKGQYGPEQRDAWITIQRSHAIANGLYVAAVNRIGHEPHPTGDGEGIEFWGSSFLAGPMGSVLAEASTDGEEILVAEVDRRRIEEVRRGWPFLRDRRIDAYAPILNRFNDGGGEA
jgi:N-carbamoylputrescine amidase